MFFFFLLTPPAFTSFIFSYLFDGVQPPLLLQILSGLVSVPWTFHSIAFQQIFIDYLWCARPWPIVIRLWTHLSTLIEFPLGIGQGASDWHTKMNKVEDLLENLHFLVKKTTDVSWNDRLWWKYKLRGCGPQRKNWLHLSGRGDVLHSTVSGKR